MSAKMADVHITALRYIEIAAGRKEVPFHKKEEITVLGDRLLDRICKDFGIAKEASMIARLNGDIELTASASSALSELKQKLAEV